MIESAAKAWAARMSGRRRRDFTAAATVAQHLKIATGRNGVPPFETRELQIQPQGRAVNVYIRHQVIERRLIQNPEIEQIDRSRRRIPAPR